MAQSSGPLGPIHDQINETTAALKGLVAPAEEVASDIERAFGRAGESLARSLARAASDGKISLGELAAALIRAVDQASSGGGQAQTGGLGGVLTQALKDVFGGARAEGGRVAPGQAYLVGERGPEIFRPATPGQIDPTGTPAQSVTINLNLSGGGAGLIRSETQIASAIQRAARLGGR